MIPPERICGGELNWLTQLLVRSRRQKAGGRRQEAGGKREGFSFITYIGVFDYLI
ncbi:MAG: hypothetical protein F6J92_02910 [Symploca sp. SIO1A3]|nr:hypothetical protein [Symploca sp. SIO1A3]